MALRLRIISAQSSALGDAASTVFGVQGGTIGRATDNDWVLPDPERFLSGHHARLEHREGYYYLTDTSSNGTYVNDSHDPVSNTGPYPLKDGDHIRMGDFEMAVTIDAANDFPPDESAIVAYDGGTDRGVRRSTENHIDADLDLADLFNTSSTSSGAHVTPVNAWGLAVESAAVAPIRKKPAFTAAALPQEATEPVPAPRKETETPKTEPPTTWHMSTRRVEPYRNPMRSAEVPSSKVDVAASGPIDINGLQALCRGAGIDPASLPTAVQAQALQLAGQLLREMVLGLMDVMQTRTEVKNRFRITDPSVQTAEGKEHNPLQFSAGVDEALRKLFEAQGKSSSRYLGPIEAVRESFQELKTHQQAVVSAMQSAFTEFMGRLDPEELRERFDRGLKRGGLLGAATNKMKYWELYADFYQSLSQKEGLPHLFVEEFAQAYAAKVKEASTSRPRSNKA